MVLVFGLLGRFVKDFTREWWARVGAWMGIAVEGNQTRQVVASLLGTGDIMELNILGSVVAIIAAVMLIGIAEGMSGRTRADV